MSAAMAFVPLSSSSKRCCTSAAKASGVAHRASNEAVKREEELEAATARHLEWRAAKKAKRKERRRRRKFDASATLSDLRAAEAMVTRGDEDMRATRKLGKAIAVSFDDPETCQGPRWDVPLDDRLVLDAGFKGLMLDYSLGGYRDFDDYYRVVGGTATQGYP